MSSPSNVSGFVYFLVIMFGISSWLNFNALWVELPILVQELPERWHLPSYIIAITQLANISPLLYVVFCSRRLDEKYVILFIIGVVIGTSLFLTVFWNHTVFIAGDERSVPLFTMNFILSSLHCTSVVTFYPFMVTFRPAYMTAYFIGEGLSGLLPGLLGLAQGTGRVLCFNHTTKNSTLNGTESSTTSYVMTESYGDINFTFEVFFCMICVILVGSGISFALLIYHPISRQEYVDVAAGRINWNVKHSKITRSVEKKQDCTRIDENDTTTSGALVEPPTSDDVEHHTDNSPRWNEMSCSQYIPSLILTAWVNCLRNSALMAVQSYSCLPYGTDAYYLSVILAQVANPLACFVNFFINVTSVSALSVLAVIGSIFGVYIMVAAIMSPTPFLVGTMAGSIIIVTVWVVCIFVLTYARVSFASLFRKEGKKSLLHCGVATQVGSAVGGGTMFVLVNIYGVFKSTDLCPR